jgi:hypothetical protein
MNFESMIGTTGVASSGEKLYIANNGVITQVDKDDKKTNISHGYDRVEEIAVSGKNLVGICVKGEKYGIFILDLLTSLFFTNDTIDYDPYNIKLNMVGSELNITVIDSKFGLYNYNDKLVQTSFVEGDEYPYENVDISEIDSETYYMTNISIKKGDRTQNNIFIPVSGSFLAIQTYQKYLFVFYKNDFNMYSIAKYDSQIDDVVTTIEGGYFSTKIYTCIYRNSIYISSTINKVFHLQKLAITQQEIMTASNVSIFSPFELNSIMPNLMEETLDVDLNKMKEKRQSLNVDVGTAEASLSYYYLWIFIVIVLVGLIVLTFMNYKTSNLNIIILIIIVSSAFFILRSYIYNEHRFL